MSFKQFIFRTIIVVLITNILCISIFKFFFPAKLLIIYFFLPFVFGGINLVIFKSLFKAQDLTLIKFSNRYLLFTTLKLLGSIVFILGFLFFNKDQAIPFLSSFLAVYLIFLTHEIIEILNYFKKNNKSESTQAKT
jgi:hypothetical protein